MTIIIQFIGFLFFIFMLISGFWCLSFLVLIIPYWIIMGILENYGIINKNICLKQVKRKNLSEQKNINYLWIKS